MKISYVTSCGLVCAALILAGCDDGRQAPRKVGVRVANVAPGFEQLEFRREQDTRNGATLSFKDSQEFVYDADTYDFFISERTLNDTAARTWTFAPQLDGAFSYTFVLTEVGGEIQPVVIEHSEPPATDAQVAAVHAASGLPALDLYLERPGVGIAGATPRGSFNAQEQIAPRLPSGDYELTLTAAGDPANVFLTTTTITLPAGTESTFVVVPEGGQGSAQISVLLLQGLPSILYDRNAIAELRYVNGATDQAPRDVAIDSQFSPPLFSAIPFGEETPYAPYPTAAAKINVTPVGNSGALELDQTLAGVPGQRATMLFAGPAGTLTSAFSVDDGRRLNLEAKLRFMSAVSQFFAVDFVITFPGEDPNVLFPVASLAAPGISSSYVPLAPGEYDLYLRQAGTVTLLSGPTRFTVAAGGLYGVLAVDGPDTATAGVRFLGDFP
ncbi:MAG: DUF4397 domain-containing protein [Lysobacterales bacterium]|nr:MAG: DUF4397 domain-containing protein [Xanthomonadales bacterium]